MAEKKKQEGAEDSKDIVSAMRTVSVFRQYKESSVVTLDEAGETQEVIEVTYPEGVPLASVSVNGRLTINMENYESIVIGASLTLPCTVPEIEDAYETAKSFVNLRLNKEAKGVRDFRAKAKKER